MPSEKFFDGATGAPRTVVELAWSSTDEYDGVYLTTYTPEKDPRDTLEKYTDVHSVIDLDRDDMNRMIRALRRARNAKYGSDE